MTGKKGALEKDNPQRVARDCTIAKKRLEGRSYMQLAKEFGLSKSRIGQILKQEEIKEIIDTGTSQMISLIPLACQVQYEAMTNRENNPALALKASETVLKTGGIIPSNVTNQTVNAVYNIQNNVTLSPGVVNALADSINTDDPDCIDEDSENEDGNGNSDPK